MVLLNGREVEAHEVWVCACSGGHFEIGEDGSSDPKCWRKGGEYRTVLVDAATGDEIAHEFDSWEVERLVRDHGWRDMGEGFLARPAA